MAASLKPGTLAQLKNAGTVEDAVSLKVTDLEPGTNKLKCNFSDGKENMSGVLTSQVFKQFGSSLKSNDIVKITEANVNVINENPVLIVAAMEVVAAGEEATMELEEKNASPPANTATKMEIDDAVKPENTEEAKPAPVEEQKPAVHAEAKTPAAHLKAASVPDGTTPKTGPTPPSGPFAGGAGAAAANNNSTAGKNRPVLPIASLNPYNHGWAIRAKVVSKGPKRAFKNGSVFTAELVDEAGTVIEGTFWKDAADRWYETLDDNKVYTFARGSVKPANKKFSQVRNDYCLHFDNGSEVVACEGIEIDTIAAKLQFVPIDQLIAFVDKKTLVDLVGVVTSVAPLGSVKRKVDAVELARRDVTIVDQAGKTVTVTLWGTTASNIGQDIEDAFHAATSNGTAVIVAISSCRVSSYNGVSVSTVTRSQVVINGDEQYTEVPALRRWWEESGASMAFTAVGEGMATAVKAQGQKGPDRLTMAEFKEAAPGSPADKPVYATVVATFAALNPERTLWYDACPENNRKVVDNGDGTWLCEYDGKSYPSMVRRYIITTPIMDATADAYVQVFNEQSEILLGRTADELASLKNVDETGAAFNNAVKSSAWGEWVLRLKAQAQEYNGETRMRYAIVEIKPVDYVAESRRMLEALAV